MSAQKKIRPEDWTDEPTRRGGTFPTTPLNEDGAERKDDPETHEHNKAVSGGGVLDVPQRPPESTADSD